MISKEMFREQLNYINRLYNKALNTDDIEKRLIYKDYVKALLASLEENLWKEETTTSHKCQYGNTKKPFKP